MVDWHLGMVEGPRGERRDRLSAADALALARFWAAPFAAAPSTRRWLAALLAMGAASDVVDGRLAARRGPTRLGRDLDVAADIAFFGATAAGVARRRWLPPRAAAWLGLRYGALLGLTAGHYFLRAAPPPRPSARWTSPLVVAALAAAAADRPRTAGILLRAGSGLSLAWQAFAVVRARAPEAAHPGY